jgi:hypothetical protein
MQVVGGLAEAGTGGAYALSTGGWGALAGGSLLIGHGFDNICTGARQLYYGAHDTPATVQLLEKTGLPSNYAYLAHDTVSLAGTTIFGALAKAAQAAAFPAFRLSSNWACEAIVDSSATSSYQAHLLKTHLKLLEKYGSAGSRHLSNGRIRYYDVLRPALSKGEMAGRRIVREWDPISGLKKTWNETLDHNGKIRIVRPQRDDNIKIHFLFDKNGKYKGVN